MKNFLAIDIGASSGRHLVGSYHQERISMKEIYRFNNQIISIEGQDCWDLVYLFEEIKHGIEICTQLGIKLSSLAIDTWGVDFVLLDKDDQLLGNAVSYRDKRTNNIMSEFFQIVPADLIYQRTGIQFLQFNTIFQLFALKKEQPHLLDQAKSFLMIPDYFNFLLTGQKVNEYTNASTTQLLNLENKDWDAFLLQQLGIDRSIFQKIFPPTHSLGKMKRSLLSELGQEDCEVLLTTSHDTAAAYLACPSTEQSIHLSTGTWALIGKENSYPISSREMIHLNYSNEGGYNYQYRILKNIMGLWLIQEVQREASIYSFDQLVQMAKESDHFTSVIDVNNAALLHPQSMIQAIKKACQASLQVEPETIGEVAQCIFLSLAYAYHQAVAEITEIFQQPFQQITIVGGGSQNHYLNQLIANITQKKVLAGPIEATALGNILAQMLALNVLVDVKKARQAITRSYKIEEFNGGNHE